MIMTAITNTLPNTEIPHTYRFAGYELDADRVNHGEFTDLYPVVAGLAEEPKKGVTALELLKASGLLDPNIVGAFRLYAQSNQLRTNNAGGRLYIEHRNLFETVTPMVLNIAEDV
jgi:hypothetical protein